MTSPYDASGYPTRPSNGDEPFSGLGPAPSPGYPEWTQQQPAAQSYPQAPYQQTPGYPSGFDPHAPYGRDPYTGEPYSEKSKVAAGLLQIIPAVVALPVGVGRFYIGSVGVGLSQLILFLISFPLMLVLIGFPLLAAVWLWVVIDGIVLLVGNRRDGRGRPLRP